MRPTCHWCSKTATGTALTYEHNQRLSCGSHGRRHTFVPHGAFIAEESTMSAEEELADWERELLDRSRIERTHKPSKYRVEIHKPFGISIVGIYTAEEYDALSGFIADLNVVTGRGIAVTRIDTEVKTVTTEEITEVAL